MATEFFLLTLLRAEVAASFAIAGVILVRGAVRRRLGPPQVRGGTGFMEAARPPA